MFLLDTRESLGMIMADPALSVMDPTSPPPPPDHLMINGFVKPLECGSRNPALMALQRYTRILKLTVE